MKQCFLKKAAGNRGLILFFGGWGSSPELFSGLETEPGYDCIFCWDYRDLGFSFDSLGGYDRVSVYAWSMGVWVAQHVLSGRLAVEPEAAIAVCGTPHPVDDLRGIPRAVFLGTMKNMSDPVLRKFRKRMCGHDLDAYMSRVGNRTVEELSEELEALFAFVTGAEAGTPVAGLRLSWNVAVIGEDDLIFPAANQLRDWTSEELGGTCETVVVKSAHYGEEMFRKLLFGGYRRR